MSQEKIKKPETDAVLVDLSEFLCPIPTLRLQKILKSAISGQNFMVLVTDPRAPEDILRFCQEKGHETVIKSEKDGCFVLFVTA